MTPDMIRSLNISDLTRAGVQVIVRDCVNVPTSINNKVGVVYISLSPAAQQISREASKYDVYIEVGGPGWEIVGPEKSHYFCE